MTATSRQFASFTSHHLSASLPLPVFPNSIAYWDDFAERTRTIADLKSCDKIEIHDDGITNVWKLDGLNNQQRSIVMAVLTELINSYDVSSVRIWMNGLFKIIQSAGADIIDRLALLQPIDLRHSWEAYIFPDLTGLNEARSLQKLLHIMCEKRIGSWAPEFRTIISNLSVPTIDPFAAVKSGECFLPAEHQQLVYNWLDELAKPSSSSGRTVGNLRVAVAIILADQHAFRPGVIARISPDDVTFHDNGAVHISAVVIKKQISTQRIRITRRMKREWCPIIRAFAENRLSHIKQSSSASHRFLGWTPTEVSMHIRSAMEFITGTQWTATDLRHTAAQRLTDSGASADQLAEFMNHNSKLVGNVYFDQSPAQAERINRAMAISPIYSKIPDIHRTKTIDKAALMGVPSDQQIGGVPHGIAIAGIGACQLGQSLCEKNPVLSCYGCRKFLAVADPDIHEAVVESLRPVVRDFYEAGKGHEKSPAYAQLQRTLTKARSIAEDLRTTVAPIE